MKKAKEMLTKLRQKFIASMARFDGELVAHKLPRQSTSCDSAQSSQSDVSGGWRDSAIIHLAGGPGEAVRKVGGKVMADADSFANGMVGSRVAGRSRPGEEGTHETCRTLTEKLNQEGGSWSQPQRPDRERGVDCQAHDGDELLQIQVTRAESRREFWRSLRKSGSVDKQSIADKCADGLRTAINKKARVANGDVTLALNALDTPELALQAVVESFRWRHGAWASQLGFKQIWVVGPTTALTHRLDLTDA